MKTNIKIIIIAAVMLGLGWFLGSFFNNKAPQAEMPQEHNHTNNSEGEEQVWTCSMHPQIRQNEPGDCPICGMDLITISEGSSNDPLVLEMTQEAVKLASVRTTIVGEDLVTDEKVLQLTGKVQADERLAASQVAHIPGRIEKLYVSFTGEPVQKGQKLADIYAPDLINAQQELIEATKLGDYNEGLLEAARKKLYYWKIDSSIIRAIEKDKIIRETFPLFADESGIVLKKRIAVGDYVKQGEVLFDLMNLKKVWVLFDAYEDDLASIKIGDRIEFTTPSIPNRTFRSSVSFIDPVINQNTRVASIRTEIRNSNGQLKPEMLVSGALVKKIQRNQLLTIPKSAVIWTGKRSVVYTKVEDTQVPSFRFQEIEIGDAVGNQYQVLSGLEAGVEVVTNGNFVIDAAAQLNNQASAMNKDVLIKGQENMEVLPDYTEEAPLEFKQQIANLADAYLQLKDALVATDPKLASEMSKEVLTKLSSVNMTLIKDDAHLFWMDQLAAMQAHGEKISASDEVEEQRKQFDFLSQALIKSVKVFGIPTDTYYVQHCPMAFDNEGADWLSGEEEILNPYFGDQMLKCGIVEETITKDFKNQPITETTLSSPTGHNH